MLADYVIRTLSAPRAIAALDWDTLLEAQSEVSPFMRHAYLDALRASGSACDQTGWQAHCLTLSDESGLAAACMVYIKDHSYGEYVFDWAWANAYAQHGLDYYPKAVVAVPFTPVPGCRLLARTPAARSALVKALIAWCKDHKLSSLHLLFMAPDDVQACLDNQLMLRHTVQFHWNNTAPGYRDFDDFLMSLAQEKRKKIRQEQRKVAQAGVVFEHRQGAEISRSDWDFFYRCYERTYLEHGNAPYLSRDFFDRMANHMPQNWLLFIARRDGRAIASSLIGLQPDSARAPAVHPTPAAVAVPLAPHPGGVAYGRYWGALERVDCLHFDACYYQPLAWCIEQGYARFEGGAQGEHKMARALLPVKTTSAHWLAHPAFADAVGNFLRREGEGIAQYLENLQTRSPFRELQ